MAGITGVESSGSWRRCGVRSALMLTNTAVAPARPGRARRSCPPIARARPRRGCRRCRCSSGTTPQCSVSRRAVVASLGGGDDRRARSERRQAPRRRAAARDRDNRLRVAAVGERDRRFAQRLGVIVVPRVGRAALHARCDGLASASRMIASSVCTVRAGYAPAAVSPASMIASTPSSTALAASLTSARVGRASLVIDSSTWVATITGMPLAARAGA